MGRSNPSQHVKDLVDARDQYRCVRCGKPFHWSGFSRHHRRLRSHKWPGLHEASNLILACGSGDTGWHVRNCRIRERRRTDPEYAQHLRDLANQRNARNREKRNEYARRYRSEHLAQVRASARKYAAAHRSEMAEYHRRWMLEHPEKNAQYEAKRKRKRQLAKEAVNE